MFVSSALSGNCLVLNTGTWRTTFFYLPIFLYKKIKYEDSKQNQVESQSNDIMVSY